MIMRTLGLLVLAVVGFAVASCQTTTLVQAGSCNAHECHLKVTVNDCTITVNPDPITIGARNVELHWDIVSSGYTFTASGIVINEDPRNEFSGGHLAQQDTKFILNDKNSFPRTYKYTVNVKRDTTTCPPLDPSIANN